MTKENFISINVILDQSGSMDRLRGDTIGGLNGFIREQKKIDGEVVFSLVKFSSPNKYNVVHNFVKLAEINELTHEDYSPNGNTALMDAIGKTITDVGTKIRSMREEERPSKVLVVIITDGFENASHIYNKSQIQAMIQHQRDKYSWEFVFLGADIASIQESKAIGIINNFQYDASECGVADMYGRLNDGTKSYRSHSRKLVSNFFDPQKKS